MSLVLIKCPSPPVEHIQKCPYGQTSAVQCILTRIIRKIGKDTGVRSADVAGSLGIVSREREKIRFILEEALKMTSASPL